MSDSWSRRVRAAMIWARAKFTLWEVIMKGGLGVIYVSVISDGLRIVLPAFGQKLHKLPGLTFLKDYEATYRLDVAPFFAVFLLTAVWYLMERVLRLWLQARDDDQVWESKPHAQLVTILAAIILGVDACLFYFAMTRMGWGNAFSFTAILATLAYMAVLIFVSYGSVNLKQEIAMLKERDSCTT